MADAARLAGREVDASSFGPEPTTKRFNLMVWAEGYGESIFVGRIILPTTPELVTTENDRDPWPAMADYLMSAPLDGSTRIHRAQLKICSRTGELEKLYAFGFD